MAGLDTRGWNLWLLVVSSVLCALPFGIGINLLMSRLTESYGVELVIKVVMPGVLVSVFMWVIPRLWPRRPPEDSSRDQS